MAGNLVIAGVNVGDVICFEVVYDDLVRDVVRGGAQVLVVQTNNATFGYTDETYQQQAMSRVRAVEHGRDVLIAATSGVIAVIRSGRYGRIDHRAVHPGLSALRLSDWHGDHARYCPRWPGGVGARRSSRRSALRRSRWSRRRSPRTSVDQHPETCPQEGATADGSMRTECSGWRQVLVIIPTYNERREPAADPGPGAGAAPDVDVLVVDDNSPDGTGAIADERAAADRAIHVLHRAEKAGLGAAYVAGFQLGSGARLRRAGRDGRRRLARTRDSCPGCWRPRSVADLVIGSRYVAGGHVVNWPMHRRCCRRRRTCTPGSRSGVRHPRHHRRLPGLPGRGAADAAAGLGRLRRGTASRSTWRGGRCRPGFRRHRGADHLHRAEHRRRRR